MLLSLLPCHCPVESKIVHAAILPDAPSAFVQRAAQSLYIFLLTFTVCHFARIATHLVQALNKMIHGVFSQITESVLFHFGTK